MMKKTKRWYGVTSYESTEQILIKESPIKSIPEFAVTIPKYLVIKENDNTYTTMKFHYVTDDVIVNEARVPVNSLRQCYRTIWDGSKTAKEAKEIAMEDSERGE